MNYEKKYKEALKRARELSKTTTRANYEYIFPELAESEDEKIRKDLIEWFDDFPDMIWGGHYKSDIIAWLEKQDDKPQGKTALEPIKEEKVDNQKCVKSVDDVEQKIDNKIEIPFGAKDSELQEETYFIPKGFHAKIDDDKVVIKKGEKPAAWSEEDERIKKLLIHLIKTVYDNTNYLTYAAYKGLIAWLEKLDDNVEL